VSSGDAAAGATSAAERPTSPSSADEVPGLDVRSVVKLALRTLPYLRPVLRELRPMIPVMLLSFVLGVPGTMLLTDLTLTRMLGAEPLTPFEVSLLGLDPASFVDVPRLTAETQRLLRSRLVWGVAVSVLFFVPIFFWLVYRIIEIQQRINQILRVEMIEHVQSMLLRFHSGTHVSDSVYRTYQDSAMVTNLMGMLVRPIFPLLGAVSGLAIALLFD
jgi:hypothetical protein